MAVKEFIPGKRYKLIKSISPYFLACEPDLEKRVKDRFKDGPLLCKDANDNMVEFQLTSKTGCVFTNSERFRAICIEVPEAKPSFNYGTGFDLTSETRDGEEIIMTDANGNEYPIHLNRLDQDNCVGNFLTSYPFEPDSFEAAKMLLLYKYKGGPDQYRLTRKRRGVRSRIISRIFQGEL